MRRLLKTSSIGTAPAKNLAMQGDSVSDGQAAKASDRAAAACLKGIKTNHNPQYFVFRRFSFLEK